MITREEAEQTPEKGAVENAAAGTSLTPMLHEFDVGYVVWAEQPPDEPPPIGADQPAAAG